MNVIAPYPLAMDLVAGIFVYLAISYFLGHYTIKAAKSVIRWLR